MIYHNITPAHFFVDFSEDLVRFTHEGRNHLERLNHCFDLAIADSKYNAAELETLDFKNVSVFPITINPEEYAQPDSEPYRNLVRDERKNILFVGRITPNKKIEDLIKMVFFYKKYLSPSIRLIVAGNTATLPKYFLALKDLAARFHLTAEDVVFTGHIPFDELLTLYRLADVFVSMSEHEGFCLPLIESCFFQLPVVAFGAGAVAETLAGAGLVIHRKQVEYVAGVVEKVINSLPLREKLIDKCRERCESYKQESDPALLYSMLKKDESGH
jgi:glycosyltransferase involved in cell wall biosynthesis